MFGFQNAFILLFFAAVFLNGSAAESMLDVVQPFYMVGLCGIAGWLCSGYKKYLSLTCDGKRVLLETKMPILN